MDLATLEYLKDTEQLTRVEKRPPEEPSDLSEMTAIGDQDGFDGPTQSVKDLLFARGGSITREEYESFKRGVKQGQTRYWATTTVKH